MTEPTAMTVTGPVPASELGTALMHEHLLHDDVDEPCLLEPRDGEEGRALLDAPVTMDLLGTLWRWPLANRENVRLTRRDGIAEELAAFAAAGGGAVVETSTVGFHPDPEGLVEIARRSGVHVVAGCGYFVDSVLPDWFDRLDVDELAAGLVRDIAEGMAGTGVRAGIIGEVGTSPRITPREEASLRASALASRETGAAIDVHLSHTVAPGAGRDAGGRPGLEALRILLDAGARPDRIVFSHLDEARDVDYAERLIAEGCVVGYDTFGTEWYWDNWRTWEPHDSQRVAAVAELCARGLHEGIVLSQDVAFKRQLRRYGGLGYDHLLTNIVPMLRDAGVSGEQLRTMLVDVPARLLAHDAAAGGGQPPDPTRQSTSHRREHDGH